MIPETTIRKLIDYILLNACSVNSSGLYNGKAGIALALFEAARYLQDEYIEEQAFNLLQEALLTKNEDISFENGLSGIGYVLLYLIENKFIDADFDELFAENQAKIESGLDLIGKQQSKQLLLSYLSIIQYLYLLNQKTINDKATYFIQILLKNADKFLIDRFSELEDKKDIYPKTEIINYFEHYLKMVSLVNFYSPTVELLDKYTKLYQRNKFTNNIIIGYYLNNIEKKPQIDYLKEIVDKNTTTAILNIYPQALSLSQRIDLLCLLNQNNESHKLKIRQLEKDLFDEQEYENLEHTLLQSVYSTNLIAGYQSGISRFLLYYIHRGANNSSRYIFL